MNLRYAFGAGTAATYDTHNPAHPSRILGRYEIPEKKEIAALIARANAAQTEWAKVPSLERGLRLDAFLDAVVARVEDIAEAVTLEQGKILIEAKAETLKGCAEGRFMVGEAARVGGHATASGRANFTNQILRRPRGVIFCITPWNFPALTPLRKLCPAIAFGNAVILKPSRFTPAASYILSDIAKAFFPKNLFQIAMIGGSASSQVIAKGKIHGVSFTGSVDTGRLVYAAAARNLIPVQLELGGKNAAIINDTDDVAGTVAQLYGAAFQTSGQRCTAISRILVQKDLAREVKALLTELADASVLGDGMKTGTQMGPLCNFPHWQDVCAATELAIKEGAKPLAGGAPPPGAGRQGGYFFRPTVLGGVKQNDSAS